MVRRSTRSFVTPLNIVAAFVRLPGARHIGQLDHEAPAEGDGHLEALAGDGPAEGVHPGHAEERVLRG